MIKVNYSNKPIILKNKDFKTILVRVIFPFKRDNNDIAKNELLPGLLHNLNNKYPTEELFTMECKKLFILNCYCHSSVYCNISYFSFDLVIPDEHTLNDNLLEKQFSFFSEMIYNPLIIDDKFSDFEFERETTNLNKDIEMALKNISSYNNMRMKELVDDIGQYSACIVNHRNQIDMTNSKILYNFYLDKIKNNNPIIFVMGNVNTNTINELSSKYLSLNKKYDVSFDVNIENYLKPRNNINNVVEDSNFRDSNITFAYKVKDMNYNDEILLKVCRDLLSSLSSRLLNKKLRDDNDLVYSSSCYSVNKYGLLIIDASINKNNLEEVKSKMFEVVSDLKDEKLIAPFLDKIKDRYRVGLIRMLDNKNSLFQEFIFTKLNLDITEEEFYNRLLKVTAKDVSLFIDKLVLDTIYFLKEGDSYE